jgi:hypothetical protein
MSDDENDFYERDEYGGDDYEGEEVYGGEEDDNLSFDEYGGEEEDREDEYGDGGFVSRVGYGDVTDGIVVDLKDAKGLSLFMRDGDRKIVNPTERFRAQVDAIARNIHGEGWLIFEDDDINCMMNMIKNIDDPKYLNPTGFILGYYISVNGTDINIQKINKVFKILDNIKAGSVKEADAIRYARYWIKLKDEIDF